MQYILQRDGLSLEILERLSYRSKLGINLKKNLHYFDPQALIDEIHSINDWYDNVQELHDLALDYRIKSIQSAVKKYHRYYPDHQARKVFDDLLGFRSLCDSYGQLLSVANRKSFRIVDMSNGKASDDGYRGVHVYFQFSGYHYPIEIQYNTFYDRQFNNWLHKYFYKKHFDNSVGCYLRNMYESGIITSEEAFKEAMQNVLRDR